MEGCLKHSMQKARGHKSPCEKNIITLVRMGEVARHMASEEGSVCQDKTWSWSLCSLGPRELSKGSIYI